MRSFQLKLTAGQLSGDQHPGHSPLTDEDGQRSKSSIKCNTPATGHGLISGMPTVSGVLVNAAFHMERNVFVSDGLASSPVSVSAGFMNYKAFLFSHLKMGIKIVISQDW